ncbi:MAG: hypothetical protein RJB08_177 [Actinomycetota bacterium]
MCGRFVASTPVSNLATIFDAEVGEVNLKPSWNVAPTSRIAGLSMVDGHRRIDTFVWGLMPKWRASRGPVAPLINARAESVAEKPSFRNLVPQQRCVIPMTGYYEWLTAKEAKRKIPYFIRRSDGAPVAAAGLFDIADDQSGGYPRACIITVAANARLSEVHDRMPAVLDSEGLVAWLEGDTAEALSVLVPAADDVLEATEVSTKVNSVRNNDPSNIDPIETQLPRSLFED